MLLAFSAIFAFIWIVGVTTGNTFSGYIHVFLVATATLVLAHCWFPARLATPVQSVSDPLHQRRLARLLGWHPRRRRP
jgi:hypothetical protein